jgi:hypothetical protein
MPPNANMVLTEIKNAIEMNAIPKDVIKAYIKELPALKMAMKSGGMLVMISVPALGIAICTYFTLAAAVKKYIKLQGIVAKIKKALFFSIFIRSILISYLSLCVTANFGATFYQEVDGGKPNYPLMCFISLVIAAGYFLANYVEKQELDRTTT